MMSATSSILIWDLDRGVLATTIDVRLASSSSATPSKKKKRRTTTNNDNTNEYSNNEVLCDIATQDDQLFALVLIHASDGSSSKCRIYQYDLSGTTNEVASLVRKIKVGGSGALSLSSADPGSFGIAVSESTVVIRMGTHHLRVLDSKSGGKLCKVEIPSEASSSEHEGDSKAVAPLEITSDGRYIVTGTANNQVILFSCDEDDEEEDKRKLRTVALLSANDDSAITHLDMAQSSDNNEQLTLLTFQPEAGVASLFDVSSAETGSSSPSLSPQTPRAQLQTDAKDGSAKVSLLHAGFHPRRPAEEIALLFRRSKRGGGSAAGSGTQLPMESMLYGGLEGTATVGSSLEDGNDKGNDGKKRKSAESLALATGDQGREASSAMDLTLAKKSKSEEAAEDEFDHVEEDGTPGQSIAERLALLSSAMEQTDEEDDDDDDDEKETSETKGEKSKFKLKSATSETLTALLTQALSSNDASQLNVVLQVTNRRLVEGTVRALQSLDAERDDDDASREGYIPALMAHVVRRMARRHSLVMPLGVWVRAVLAATARGSARRTSHSHDGAKEERMAREGREMAMKLGPLKNFLNERVESFPQLLRLEGRLALLNQQL